MQVEEYRFILLDLALLLVWERLSPKSADRHYRDARPS